MNGRIARKLRKEANFQPNATRGTDEYEEKTYTKMELNKNGVIVPVTKITRSLNFKSAAARYRDLKDLYYLANV